ncbi:MAG: hypothetical protein OXO54_09465 [Chloroflexota bacterium]|nr:hypothetical protein [Chloroflexota bacterium]MDE2898535.1 hypothetical protein [Chloroflexota bacterium]
MRICRFIPLLLALSLALAFAACGEDADDHTSGEAPPAAPAASDAAPGGKVSANNATAAELEAAFAAAGIRNPGTWAHEVEHNRPFPADDTEFAKLRRGLADHNAAPDVVETIIAQLKLP